MSRNNIWVHLSIALALILVAALAGGVRQLKKTIERSHGQVSAPASKPDDQESNSDDDDKDKVEVLVRFRAGTTREIINRITSQFHDEVEDRIESVEGLDVIEDEDGQSAADVVAQYRSLPEVEYAETNSEIVLDHEDRGRKHVHADDEMFFNSGDWPTAERTADLQGRTSVRCVPGP